MWPAGTPALPRTGDAGSQNVRWTTTVGETIHAGGRFLSSEFHNHPHRGHHGIYSGLSLCADVRCGLASDLHDPCLSSFLPGLRLIHKGFAVIPSLHHDIRYPTSIWLSPNLPTIDRRTNFTVLLGGSDRRGGCDPVSPVYALGFYVGPAATSAHPNNIGTLGW